jgi:hypothetical protein
MSQVTSWRMTRTAVGVAALVEDDYVIQTLAANRADNAFDVCALPL